MKSHKEGEALLSHCYIYTLILEKMTFHFGSSYKELERQASSLEEQGVAPMLNY